MGFSPPLIASNRVTVASLLKSEGYTTGCIGKWHLGLAWPKNEKAQLPADNQGKGDGEAAESVDWTKPLLNGPTRLGFDYYYGITASLDMPPFVFIENDRVTVAPTTQKKWLRAGPAAADFEAEEVMPTLTRKAADWIGHRAKDKNPFFLYLALTAPHTPIVPTKEWREQSKLNPYGDFVMQTDAAVGEVLNALDRAGLAKNTLVIFTSDNGCSPAAGIDELRSKGHSPSGPWRGFKADIWEGGHRVPFLARWPGHVPVGKTSDETICLSDLLATSAALAGAKLPNSAGEDSVNILPALLGKKGKQPLREATVHHSIDGRFAIRQGPWKLALCPGSGGWSSPKDAAAAKQGLPEVQLFDLATDPAETKNVQAEHPEIVARLTALLEKYVADGRSTPGSPQPNDEPISLWKRKNTAAPEKSGTTATANPTAAQLAVISQGPPIGEKRVYKKVGDRELNLFVVKPKHWNTTDQRPAAVFFHGGGWVGGTPAQFNSQANYLATRGMVCALVEYRLLKNQPGALPTDCVRDAKSAMRWIRSHAAELGIDPKRIAAAGGSAGGHLAAFTGLVDGMDDPADDLKMSARPAALVLFNPVFNNGPGEWGNDRVGKDYLDFSPAHHITSNAPPAIIFLGTADALIRVKTVEDFKANMAMAGVRCETRFYPDQPHGFFNASPFLTATLIEADRFLGQLGWLKGPPPLQMPALSSAKKN